MSTDVIALLRQDHQDLRTLFAEFENAGGDAYATKQRLADQIIAMLTVHTYLKKECVYPRVRALVPGTADDILTSSQGHRVADGLCRELDAMSPDDERFTPKMLVLMENVRHHIAEEEDEWFPTLREKLGRTTLQEIGQEMLVMRATAPRHPGELAALEEPLGALSV
jgi:hemerythrin superfamily protein